MKRMGLQGALKNNKQRRVLLLHNKNFVLLWLDSIFSQISYNFVNFALLVLVYQLTRSNFAVALLILTIIIPTALLSVFTGVFADFFDRRKIMLYIDILWATLVLCFIFFRRNILAIFVLSFIINCVDRFFTPAEQASLPSLVSKKDLIFANSLFSISNNVCFIFGMTLAGPAMFLLGDDSPFLIASISTYLGAICVYFLPPIKTNESKKSAIKLIIDDTFSAIKSGYNFIFKKRVVLTAIIFLTCLQTAINIGSSLAPGYAEDTLGINVRHASLIFAFPIGFGLLFGIYLLNKWQGKILKREIVQRGLLVGSAAVLILGVGPLISNLLLPKVSRLHLIRPLSHLLSLSGLTFLAAFLLGITVAFVSIPTTTILSESTPPFIRGRVWGAASMFQNGIAALPLIFMGIIADKVSILPLTFLFAFLALVAYNLTKKKSLEGFFYG